MIDYKQPASLDSITLIRAYVKDENHFAFVGQKFLSDDSWQHMPTYIIFYHGNRPPNERWTVHKLDRDTWVSEVHGAWCEQPEPCWLFGYRSGGRFLRFNADGGQTGEEQMPNLIWHDGRTLLGGFIALGNIKNAHVYAVSTLRMVQRREDNKHWTWLNNGIPKLDYYGKDDDLSSQHGFEGISGFADNDLYACGGRGDLWHYDGQQWLQVDIPTNANLMYICCGDDGLVYITTNLDTILVGRGEHWEVIVPDPPIGTIESVIWYRDRCLINTASRLFEIQHGELIKSPLNNDCPSIPSHISARGDILLIASDSYSEGNEVSYYDGHEWHRIIAVERPSHDPGLVDELIKEIWDNAKRRSEP